jgi:hypothetical protein
MLVGKELKVTREFKVIKVSRVSSVPLVDKVSKVFKDSRVFRDSRERLVLRVLMDCLQDKVYRVLKVLKVSKGFLV